MHYSFHTLQKIGYTAASGCMRISQKYNKALKYVHKTQQFWFSLTLRRKQSLHG